MCVIFHANIFQVSLGHNIIIAIYVQISLGVQNVWVSLNRLPFLSQKSARTLCTTRQPRYFFTIPNNKLFLELYGE